MSSFAVYINESKVSDNTEVVIICTNDISHQIIDDLKDSFEIEMLSSEITEEGRHAQRITFNVGDQEKIKTLKKNLMRISLLSKLSLN